MASGRLGIWNPAILAKHGGTMEALHLIIMDRECVEVLS